MLQDITNTNVYQRFLLEKASHLSILECDCEANVLLGVRLETLMGARPGGVHP